MADQDQNYFQGWMWGMFQEYVRKITRTASTGAMPEEEMRARYEKMFRDFEIKVMVSDKVGMIVQFLDLDVYHYEDLKTYQDEKSFLTFLAEKYGRGKFKINLYDEGTFIATKNFKIEEEGEEKWRGLLKERED